MSHEEHTSHTNPGFGKNTGGLGILIVAVVVVLLGLVAWKLWNHGQTEVDHYRLSAKASGHDGHTEGNDMSRAATTPASSVASVNPKDLGTLDPSGNFIYHVGDTIALKLPDGSLMKVGDRSTEARLLRFLADGNMQVDTVNKTIGWITCDRIFFESGKAGLTASSQLQVKNIASILKAFPSASVKVGGYTDNTGDSAINQKVSQARADMVMKAIAAAGVVNAMAAEGYGPMWPLANNETLEGKAINRRVDIRVTKK